MLTAEKVKAQLDGIEELLAKTNELLTTISKEAAEDEQRWRLLLTDVIVLRTFVRQLAVKVAPEMLEKIDEFVPSRATSL